MEPSDPQTITRLLRDIGDGRPQATEALLPLVYRELRGLAGSMFRDEREGHTLQPTALVHEAWMKLGGHLERLDDRRHFFVVAAKAMRQVLADHARARGRVKRSASGRRVTLDGELGAGPTDGFDLVDLDDTLSRLAELNARHAEVVELRVLGGLTIAETAAVLGVSHGTVEADWFTARAWLRKALERRS